MTMNMTILMTTENRSATGWEKMMPVMPRYAPAMMTQGTKMKP